MMLLVGGAEESMMQALVSPWALLLWEQEAGFGCLSKMSKIIHSVHTACRAVHTSAKSTLAPYMSTMQPFSHCILTIYRSTVFSFFTWLTANDFLCGDELCKIKWTCMQLFYLHSMMLQMESPNQGTRWQLTYRYHMTCDCFSFFFFLFCKVLLLRVSLEIRRKKPLAQLCMGSWGGRSLRGQRSFVFSRWPEECAIPMEILLFMKCV